MNYVRKEIEIGDGIVHGSMSNNDYYKRGSVLDTHPEDSENMKDVNDNINNETQKQLAEL